MLFSSFFKSKKAISPFILGIAENEHYYCVVSFDHSIEPKEPLVTWFAKPIELQAIVQQITQRNPTYKRSKWVRPMPYSYIWRKTAIHPIPKDRATLFRQVVQTLKQELPIPLEDVYFDFYGEAENGQSLYRVKMFALRKSFADPYLLKFPYIETILDCELHCWQRGISFLYQTQHNDQKEIKNYLFKEKVFEFKSNELAIHNEISPETANIAQLTFENEIFQPELYILALGAALWKN